MNGEISVLLVDDERSVAELAATHLERLHDGLTVETETAAETALERFEREPASIDCLVSDYTMPEMDGLDFLAAVRERDSEIPFVLFTGEGSEGIASEAIAAGVTDYLQKGTNTEQYRLLANRIENAVAGYRASERADTLARINRVVAGIQRELVGESTREGIERRVCERLAESAPYSLAWIGVDDDDFAIRERAGRGTDVFDDVSIPLSGESIGPVGRAFVTGDPQVVRDVTDDEAFEPWDAATDCGTFGSVITLPLSDTADETGPPDGVLGIYSSDRRAFADAERDALAELAGTIAQAIHAAETRERLERRERALAESERKYRSLIDVAPDAIIVADADTGEIIETNAAATELLDCDRETILEMDQPALHPEGEAERYRELFAEGIATGDPGVVRFADGSPVYVERADGERVPVEIDAGIVAVGDRTLVHGRFRDMTDQRARERELREERAMIQSLFDATPDPIYAIDADGEMLRWNETFRSVVGYADEEIGEMNALDFIPSEDHELIEHSIEAVVEEGKRDTMESALVTNAGESIPHEFNGAPYSVDGRRGLIGVGRDITARKARERERERYRTTIEAVDDAVYVLDDEGRFEFVNGAFSDLTGYDRAEVLGEDVSLIKDDDTVRLFEDVLRDLLSTGTGERTVEFELQTANGDRVPCEDHLAVRMVEGEFQGVAGAIRDATERRDREATVAALHEATRALMRAENPEGVASATATAAKQVLGFPLTAVRRYDPETDCLEPAAVTDMVAERYGERPTYARGEGLPWRAFESGTPLVAPGEAVSYRSVDFDSALYVPIGEHGTLSIVSLDREFDDADVELTRVLAANAATALDRLNRERELAAARSRFRALTENTTLGILTIDGTSTICYANDAMEDVFGYAADELVGESLTTLMPERFHEDHFEGLARHLRDGSRALDWEWAELPGEHRAGHEMDLGVSFGKHSEGEEYRFTATVRDITGQKRHERAISTLHDATRGMMNAKRRTGVAETSVEAVARVLDMPLNGIWLHDEEGTLRPAAISERGHETFGSIPTYAAGDGLTWKVFESGETRYYDRVDHQPDAHNPETPVRSEMLVPLGDHGVLVVGSTEHGGFDEGDRSLVKLLGANTEAALDRAERERQLVVERDRLGALFENVPDAALSYEFVDDAPVVRSVNARFEDVFGYTATEIIGENIDEYVLPPDHGAEGERLNDALLSGETLQRTVRRETADGIRDFLLHVVPIDRGERNAEGYSIYTDITDRMVRQRDLERQNELLDEFASVISHDLRNPMSVARGRLELAEADAPTDHHEDVFWALDRMETLIEDVLTLARQGRRIDETERVSLPDVAERAWHTAGTESATLTLEDPGVLEADPDRLVRLFENLFRNAVEHAGESSTVIVGGLDDGFFLEDDGPGVPEDEREAVFEGGYTTIDSGTGLGLMIVRSIAEAHGWTIHVADSDRGTRFEVHT